MQKIKIIGRQKIINTSTGKIHDDDGLKALNGYIEKDIFYSGENIDKIIDEIISKHPDFANADYEIEIIFGGEAV